MAVGCKRKGFVFLVHRDVVLTTTPTRSFATCHPAIAGHLAIGWSGVPSDTHGLRCPCNSLDSRLSVEGTAGVDQIGQADVGHVRGFCVLAEPWKLQI